MDKKLTKEVLEKLIENRMIPITYRNVFKNYLEWCETVEEWVIE